VKKHHWIALTLALLIAGAFASAEWARQTQRGDSIRSIHFLTHALQRLEWSLYDLRFKWRGARKPHPDVAIVAINDSDLKAVGQWPWSRGQHARLIRTLEKAAPKALLFDIFFIERMTADPAGDRSLVSATRAHPWVVHSMFFKLTKELEVVGMDRPFDDLLDAAPAIGYANAVIDDDGVLRRAIPELHVQDQSLPLLSVIGAHLYQGKAWDARIEGVPQDAGGHFRVNFAGPAWTFPYLHYSDVISGKVPASALAGKVIVYGSNSTGLFDHYPTSMSEFMPGLEFHANVLDNMLSGNAIRAPHYSWSLWIVLGMGLFCGLILARVSPIMGAVLAVAIGAGYIGVAQWLFSHRFLALDMGASLLTLFGGYLAVITYRFFSEEKEKRWVKAAFGQYVSPKVLDILMADPSRLSLVGERREMTMLFSDVAGFTSISERLNPDELVVLLNKYLSAMTEVIFHYDGYLNKYMGDGIMAFWNAPLKQADHAARACRCALRSKERLAQLNEELVAQGLTPLKARIGVNSGTVVVGNMGSIQKSDYTVMGDAVNLASRLEGANKPYGTSIMISEFTYDIIHDQFEVRYLDRLRVPGKAKPVKTYELLAEKGRLSPMWEKALPLYHEAILLYSERKYDLARAKFLDVSAIVGQDKVCEAYLERTQEFMLRPPAKDWDGVYDVHTK